MNTNTTRKSPAQTMARVTLPSYSPCIMVPASKLGALIDLLASCKVVSHDWIGGDGDSQYANVLTTRPIEVDLNPDAPITQAEANAIRDGIKAEEAAKKAAAAEAAADE